MRLKPTDDAGLKTIDDTGLKKINDNIVLKRINDSKKCTILLVLN